MAIWSRFFGSGLSTATGYAIGSAMGPTLNPLTQELANDTWERFPNVPLTPEQAAEATIRDLLSVDEAHDEGAMNGTNVHRMEVLRGLAGNAPAPEELLELWNRSALKEPDVDRGLRQGRLRPEWYPALKKLRFKLTPVADLVRMAVREVFSPEQRAALDLDAEFPAAFAARAAELGLTEAQAREYWAAHWELPSYTQLATMRFRGLLTAEQFSAALKAADYAPTWRERLEEIARAIPPISDMIRFAVREVYDPAKRSALGLDDEYPAAFTAQAAKHGMREDDARDYWAAHWNLPSATQGYTMLWRGEITEAELDGLLKALDYSPAWRSKLKNIAYHVPGRVDLRRMYAEGVIDRARLKRGYLDLGYTNEDAETLTDFAVKLANKSTGSTAQTHTEKAQTQLWTRTHTSYLAGDTDDAQALDKLASAGVDADERPKVLALWKEEREVIRARMTPAQWKKAWSKAVTNPATGQPTTKEDALAELISRGWSTQDANMFLDE